LNFIEFMLAVATPAPTTDPAPPFFGLLNGPMPLIIGGLIIFMLFSSKNKNRGEEKQRVEMLKQLKRSDRIQTTGGILGSVMRVEENRVEVKVDESSNTKIWFARSSILKVTEPSDKVDKTEKSEKNDKAETK
jgi:preprotein translocase subunit YajC